MAVTPAMIKELRESTNAGLMDCKKALAASDGDMQAAVDWLRKKGLSKAAKVAGKIAAEGLVAIKIEDGKAVILEVNSETDFVAKNENFVNFVNSVLENIFTTGAADVEALKASTFNGQSFDDFLGEATAKIGEKIDIRRFTTFEGCVNGYVHANGRIGSIVCAETDVAEGITDTLKDIAMHATAMNPQFLDDSEIPAEVLAKEEEMAKEQLKKEGKPEAIWDKIIPGKLKRYAKDNCLVDQMYVKDDKVSVAQALAAAGKAAGGSASIAAFARFEVGEGMEKKEEDFAAEVAAQMGK